jgi:hypothetical protein
MNASDIIYCNGSGCGLRWRCRRYLEGQRIVMNTEGDTDQHEWMDNCSEDTREGFIQALPEI